MRLAMLCFSDKGLLLGRRLTALLPGDYCAKIERCPRDGLENWTRRHFAAADALVFIGAAGIAVRAVAPFIRHKTHDPAVLVIDECAGFVIPILSGHIGGGNALAHILAHTLGAQAIITTATDCRGLLAIDAWAARQGYAIANPEQIKAVSARLLAGNALRLKSDFATEVAPQLAGQIILAAHPPFDVAVTISADTCDALRLVPPVLALGVGCKRDTPAERLQAAFMQLCADYHLSPAAFYRACSIDLKAQEEGLLTFCKARRLPFVTFSAEALQAVAGAFSASDFVRGVTGVDNVCERSAVLGSGGKLLVAKRAYGGITLAVAQMPHNVRLYPAESFSETDVAFD